MEKLELKHLAPYLTHSLKTYHKGSSVKIHDLRPFDCGDIMIKCMNDQETKLILRPLSDLTEDELKEFFDLPNKPIIKRKNSIGTKEYVWDLKWKNSKGVHLADGYYHSELGISISALQFYRVT